MTVVLHSVLSEPAPIPNKRGGAAHTAQGREQARRNALKLGLRSKVVFPEELAAAIAVCDAMFKAQFRPQSTYERTLVGEMSLARARIDLVAALSIEDVGRCAERALLFWEDDRRTQAEELGARLPRSPALVSHALERTKQGAEWAITRWDGLATALRSNGDWDDDQRR